MYDKDQEGRKARGLESKYTRPRSESFGALCVWPASAYRTATSLLSHLHYRWLSPLILQINASSSGEHWCY